MSSQITNHEELLDRSAIQELQDVISDLRTALLHEAWRESKGDAITDDDIRYAANRLSFPSKDSLRFADAQAVISKALRENRIFEAISYVMAVILFVFGLVLLSIGAANDDVASRVGFLFSGTIVELLILVPWRFVINSRRHNIALRMLGLIINRVNDPDKLAPLLKDTFLAVVLGEPRFNVTKNK